MKQNKFIVILLLFTLIGQLIAVDFALAAETAGVIDTTYKYVWSENIGWLNFGATEGDVSVTDTGLSGYVWAENAGWIDLNPVYGGVSNDVDGNLSGYAWGENTGWIDFNPTYGGVTIDSAGDFNGYAWGENIGWIVFNCAKTGSCSEVDYKLKTNWVTLTCGNGLVEAGEYCDDGNTISGDGCSSICAAEGGAGIPLPVNPPQAISKEQATEQQTASLLINQGALYAHSRRVNLNLSAKNASQMAISNEESFEGISWEKYQTSRVWYLEIGDGVKNVYIKFRGIDGSVSAAVFDSIILDTLSPEGLVIVYPADGEKILDQTPLISGTAEANSKVFISLDDLIFYQTLADLKGGWSYKINTPLKLSKHKLAVKSQDGAGNFSSEQIIYFEIAEKEAAPKPEAFVIPPSKEKEVEKPIKEPEKIIPEKAPEEIIPEKTLKEIPEKIIPIEEIISKEELLTVEEPELVKERIFIGQEIKKKWRGIGVNLKDAYLEIKELAVSDFKNVIKNPFFEIKEASKDLGKSGAVIVRGFFQSSARIVKGAGQGVQSLSLKIARGFIKAVKNTILVFGRTGKKIFLAFQSAPKSRLESPTEKQPAAPPIEVQPIEPPIVVKEPSLAPKQILEEKPVFVSAYGDIKIKSAEKEQAVLSAGSSFKSFIKPTKPVKEIKGKLIFVKNLISGVDTRSFIVAQDDNKNVQDDKPSVMLNLFQHLSYDDNSDVILSKTKNPEVAAIDNGIVSSSLRARYNDVTNVIPNDQQGGGIPLIRKLLGFVVSYVKGISRFTAVPLEMTGEKVPFKMAIGKQLFFAMIMPSRAQAQEKVVGIFDSIFDAAQAKEWLIGEFVYSDFDKDGIYEAEIQLPPVPGEFSLATVISYVDGENKIIETEILIDPEGYVYSEEIKGKETRIPQAEISIYYFNSLKNEFEIWSAGKYDQKNPQITDKTGQYSFLTPEGRYYLEVKAKGYKIYKSEEFFAVEGQSVHQNIKLIPLGFFEKIWE